MIPPARERRTTAPRPSDRRQLSSPASRVRTARIDHLYQDPHVEAQWRILQQPQPEDYVIATGEQHSVRELVEAAFAVLDIPIEWQGKGLDEQGIDARSGRTLIAIDPSYFRPTEVDSLLSDAAKARRLLGWRPRRSFAEMVAEMVRSDLREAEREHLRADPGGKDSTRP